MIDCVRDSLRGYIDNVASLEAMLSNIDQKSINREHAREYAEHIAENEHQLEKVLNFKANLYESLVDGAVSRDEYASYKAKYTRQAEQLKESIRELKEKLNDVLENKSERSRWTRIFTQFATLKTLDRKAVVQLIRCIRVVGKKELDISFTYEDEFQQAMELVLAVERDQSNAG